MCYPSEEGIVLPYLEITFNEEAGGDNFHQFLLENMAAKIVLTINFRDGSTRTISQPTGPDNDKVCYEQLIKSLNYVQEQSNAILTTLVEQEKVQKNGSNVGSKASSNNGITTCKDASEANSNSGNDTEDEGDDDEDDDDSTDKPPPEKRLKT